MCCAPCSCYPTEKLRAEGFEPVGYFFNPNIHPHQEWRRRLTTAREFAEKVGIKIFVHNHYGLRQYLQKVSSLVDDSDTIQYPDGFHKRCAVCYAWRLNEAAQFAAENNFKIFTSTLFYSRHQNHELMKKIAEQAAKNFGVEFFYEDFRIGWQRGIDISLELELYRQNYCGCIFSEEERFSNDLRKARKKFFTQSKQDAVVTAD
ncbi:MAG: epoxyqueuosine reductase QueH [Selenomonadaceae bacterium]|nr:epoxyqueuosine reductase QueH [Selenomonadaceae bacterium]